MPGSDAPAPAGRQQGPVELGGLEYGLLAWHLRVLCEPAGAFGGGGAGMTPQQVAELTPDQAYFRLASLDLVRKRSGIPGIKKLSGAAVASLAGSDGMAAGRLADGRVVRKPLSAGGRSLAGRLAAAAKQRKQEERVAKLRQKGGK